MKTPGVGGFRSGRMKTLGASVFAGLLLAAPAGAQTAAPLPLSHWGDFGEPEGQLIGASVDIRVLRGAGFWVLERTQHKIKPAVRPYERFDVMTWADGRSCPAIKDQMAKLRDVAWPQFDLPPEPGAPPAGISIIEDGSTAYLDAPVIYGTKESQPPSGSHVRLRNYGQGPVLNWVSATLRAVDGCWSSTKPQS